MLDNLEEQDICEALSLLLYGDIIELTNKDKCLTKDQSSSVKDNWLLEDDNIIPDDPLEHGEGLFFRSEPSSLNGDLLKFTNESSDRKTLFLAPMPSSAPPPPAKVKPETLNNKDGKDSNAIFIRSTLSDSEDWVVA